MGAGAAKFPPESNSAESNMSMCESCSAKFTTFKRKKCCFECGRNYCSSCTEKIPENTSHRRCARCNCLVSGHFTRTDLDNYKARELQQFLTKRKVPVQNCREKNDLVDLIMKFSNNAHYQAEQREHERHLQSLQLLRDNLASPEGGDTSAGSRVLGQGEIPQPPRYSTLNTAGNSQARTQTPPYDQPPAQSATSVPSQSDTGMGATSAPPSGSNTQPASDQNTAEQRPPSFMKLSHVESLESIKQLTTRQLKEILSGNFVDYKGCVEKAELTQRVERLYVENEANRKVALEIEDSANPSAGESELCKICMDHVVDCVLLECGHMLTCTQCGRQLAECPICRQYVVRVVHVFKS